MVLHRRFVCHVVGLTTGLALLGSACSGTQDPPPDTSAEPSPSNPPPGVEPSGLTTSRDGRVAISLPLDLVAQPFASTLMATSPDGSFRLHVELRRGGLLEVLGPLKDELIALGWELESEKHFQTAIHIQLAQGSGKTRMVRALWLVERRERADSAEPATSDAPSPTHTPPPPVAVLCEAHATSSGAHRLGDSLRAICQTVEVR